MSPAKTLAFFGSTGGCALAALELSLNAGYSCSALVRSSKKLMGMLSKTTPTDKLRIVEGNALDAASVRDALVDPATGDVVDTIVYGLGMRPDTSNPLNIKFPEPTLCNDTSQIILNVLAELKPTNPPFMVVISTTGVTSQRDVPYLMMPLYHWMLKVPHVDKRNLENNIEKADKSIVRDWIIVRPSLLTDGDATHGSVKTGYEGSKKGVSGTLKLAEGGCGWRGVEGVAIGYTISRKDVGAFIFEEAVVGDGSIFKGKKVTITY